MATGHEQPKYESGSQPSARALARSGSRGLVTYRDYIYGAAFIPGSRRWFNVSFVCASSFYVWMLLFQPCYVQPSLLLISSVTVVVVLTMFIPGCVFSAFVPRSSSIASLGFSKYIGDNIGLYRDHKGNKLETTM